MKSIDVSDFKIVKFDEINSTSTYLKERICELENLTLVESDFQTNGHGRMERKWMANKGEAILFSLLIKDEKIIKNFAKLSLLSANCVFYLLNDYIKGVSIKWPNDVYINDKKVSGILLESKSIDGEIIGLILGIGVNINTKFLPDEIKESATSLYLETGKTFDIKLLKDKLYRLLAEGLNQLLNDDNSYLDNVRKYNYLKDKKVIANINGNEKEVVVLDINDDNSLKLLYDNEIYNLSIGEITFHK